MSTAHCFLAATCAAAGRSQWQIFLASASISQHVQTAAGVTIVLALGGYLLAVTQGAAVILAELTDLTYIQGLVVSWVSYTLFTLYSGSRGVILTDTLFTIGAFFALVYLVDAQGGWITAVEGLVQLEEKPEILSWHGVVGPDT
jgi:sodium/pantothenate symporter